MAPQGVDSSFFTDFQSDASALPLHFREAHPTLRAPHHLVKNAWTPHDKPRRSIVIVDDEKSYVELMAQLLAENLDCAVHAFTRPIEALNCLDTVAAAVIVTDYSMPQINGIEFIKQASKVVPDATFVLISGEDLDPLIGEIGRLRRLKIRLKKPFGWRPLAESILKVWPGADPPAYRLNGEDRELAAEIRLGVVSPLP
jgi:DNA-binding NarL/FixJ family response regulator